jgi:hypothetical protein
MRFLEIGEILEWCDALGVAVDDGRRPSADPSLAHTARRLYASGQRSGRESSVARAAVRALGSWDHCLLWITQVGVWPSTEDWPAYYAMRGQLGEKRSVE